MNYLFYCFYCLVSAKKFDREGTARDFLLFFITFTIINIYIIVIGLLDIKSRYCFAIVVIGLAGHVIFSKYYKKSMYNNILENYEQNGEPHRVRYALIGTALLLTSLFLPFLLIKIFILSRWFVSTRWQIVYAKKVPHNWAKPKRLDCMTSSKRSAYTHKKGASTSLDMTAFNIRCLLMGT